MLLSALALPLLALLLPSTAVAQGGFEDVGNDSAYWHFRYHGLLSMASYGDPAAICPATFTRESLARNYPDSTAEPFVVVDTWGPTAQYGVSGYSVRVAEMNKIVMVISDVYGWQNFNATLAPLVGYGCDSTCMAHTGAMEAAAEVKALTNDMQAIKENQGDLVWSASGHGFGGMVMQLLVLDLKSRGLAYSGMSFGAPPVFNEAAANRYDALFVEDPTGSQRIVSWADSIPTAIPVNGTSQYRHTNTGIHVFGTNPMYGQDYRVCYDKQDPECLGGDSEADHWFYFTEAGTCGGGGYTATHNATREAAYLANLNATYWQTATAPIGTPVTSGFVSPSSIASSSAVSSEVSSTASAPSSSSVEVSLLPVAPSAISPPPAALAEASASASATPTGAASRTSISVGLFALAFGSIAAIL